MKLKSISDFRWLKRYMPRGLYGRAALILLVPMVTLQLVATVVFIQRHYGDVARQMTRALVLDVRLIQRHVNEMDDPSRARSEAALLGAQLRMGALLGDPPPAQERRIGLFDFSGRAVAATLEAELPELLAVDLLRDRRIVMFWVKTDHGPLRLSVLHDRVSAANPHQFLVLMLFVGALMTLIAFIYLRNQLRPIKRLARAAEAFGRGQVVPYRPSGAIEVRAAGAAFLQMRARIERQIEQRMLMLSSVSHDLRTPLTRLKLAVSLMEDDPAAADLLQDIDHMERMIGEFLDFTRGEAQSETEPTDPCALARRLVEMAGRAGARIELAPCPEGPGPIDARPEALERALDNLLQNALRHGERVRMSIEARRGELAFVIEDDGPGIPAEAREKVSQPFVRLDEARSHNRGASGSASGGVGLGMAIAADIARRHGGRLELGESADLGGLKVALVLPRRGA